MSAYYNENDPFAAAWLRELIKAGLIADGEVDERSIADVRGDDLRGFTQCHFFAGIGGWSYALRLAGWPDDREVWTGSCPCQPFSAAGKAAGADDSRHLWPTWFGLISERRPVVCFGEQVASADGLGWFDRVSTDMEAANYAIAAVDLCAPSIGAFHIRQRLWFVADSECAAGRSITQHRANDFDEIAHGSQGASRIGERGESGTVAHAHKRDAINGNLQRSGEHGLRAEDRCPDGHSIKRECAEGTLDDSQRERAGRSTRSEGRKECAPQSSWEDEGRRELQAVNAGAVSELGNAESAGLQRQRREQSAAIRYERGRFVGLPGVSWADADWLACIDGKVRPVEPSTFPLAHGIPARVGRLRGYGNAIVPQVAQVFIEAYLDCCSGEASRGTV